MKEELRFLKGLIKRTEGCERTSFKEERIYQLSNEIGYDSPPDIEWLVNSGYLKRTEQKVLNEHTQQLEDTNYYEASPMAYEWLERRNRDLMTFWISIVILLLTLFGVLLQLL